MENRLAEENVNIDHDGHDGCNCYNCHNGHNDHDGDNSQNGHWSKGGSRESDIHNVNLFTQIEISVQNFTPKMRKF